MHMEIPVRGMAAWEVAQSVERAVIEAWGQRTVRSANLTFSNLQDDIPLEVSAAGLPAHPPWKEWIEQIKGDTLYSDFSTLTVALSDNWAVVYNANDGGWPKVRLICSDQPRNNALERDMLRALKSALPVIPQSDQAQTILGEKQLEGLKFAQQVIGSFATEAARLSQDTAKHFEQFVAGVKTRTLELEEQFQRKSTELDEASQKRQQALDTEHQAKLKDLENREKAHVEAVKLFELRNNTAVRRDLLEKIKTKIEEQKALQVSAGTNNKRRVIHGICVSTMAISLIVVGVFVWKVFEAQSIDWHLIIPLGAWTSIFVSTGVFYLRWNDQWFRDHAKAEFETRKFSADILRASWVAELLFEWDTKKEGSIPPELVKSFTKNLFDSSAADSKLHPADQLADLLKQVSSLEISKGGLKMSRKDSSNSDS